jgi:hypothetical protein
LIFPIAASIEWLSRLGPEAIFFFGLDSLYHSPTTLSVTGVTMVKFDDCE